MPENKTLIGFRVSESFRKRMEVERIKRRVSMQDMIKYALELYFQTPVEWDSAKTTYYTGQEALSKKEADEFNSWTDLWEAYINGMPRQKTLFMAEAMKMDLLHYQSSRRKRAAAKGTRGAKP